MSSELPYDPEIPDLDEADPTESGGDDVPGVGGVPGLDDDCADPALCAYTEYVEGEEREDLPATGEGAEGVEADVWDALYGVEDPEMPVSIVDLGLVYGVEIDERVDGGVHAQVLMTLTYSGCPARDMLTDEVERAVAGVEGVESVDLRLVWSPEWSVEMVTEAGKDDLREFGLSV
ncbi:MULTISPECIES: 1,2-phenylacetyl-CoA epoxidase subunit PaaD [Halorussus]|uniref:1,2-phenylacetyl-CoA epoxidase subunit PaaD n=1 Tax=Halorussus TaxID=1070314 RepID=UPI000E20F2ED|nr:MULTISPECIES: 1,2-phenylacetyl-CoA epoxidase subunit PaaD [Halorussus]NHN59053.1 metal-sulfur cluster assembly factor [Halorussus sp. JP-T4]